jgi:hypothetical protein
MKKIERIGKLPVNSRILVDYTKNPPTIDFEYPDPDTSVIRKSDATYLFSIFIAGIMMIIFIFGYVAYIQPKMYTNISSLDTTINEISVVDFQRFNQTSGHYINGTHYGFDKLIINYTWNNKPRSTSLILSTVGSLFPIPVFEEAHHGAFMDAVSLEGMQALILVILFVILAYVNSFWVAKIFTNTKFGNKNYPKLNKKLHDARYSAEFFPKDLPANNIIEIPLFKNMYMDYDATEDFADYLQKVSIIEHPFNIHIRKGWPFIRLLPFMKKTEIKKPQVYLWKCVFEFKEKPKDGQLIVRWT